MLPQHTSPPNDLELTCESHSTPKQNVCAIGSISTTPVAAVQQYPLDALCYYVNMNTKRVLRVVTAGVALMLLCEGAARLYVSRWPRREEFRLSHPLAYRDSPYWSPEFMVAQITDASASMWLTLDDGMLYHANSAGLYYNSQNSIRVTTNQPGHAAHTIWLFGSSALYGDEVPDGYTIASYLQRDIGGSYRVVNMGRIAIDATKQVALLRKVTVQRGDIVVFYDGVPDMLSAFYAAYRRENSSKTACNIMLSALSQLETVNLLCFDTLYPSLHVKPADVDAAYSQYIHAITEARHIAERESATFYHFLQPHIFSKTLSVYEKSLVDNPRLTEYGIGETVAAVWTVFEITPNTIDLTHCLDSLRASGSEIYLDNWHVTERGNAVIARAIADVIAPTF